MTIANRIISFNNSLSFDESLPDEVEIMNPYQDDYAKKISQEFYSKYYNDRNQRIAIFGINPGRFGAGITGIPFTDPVNLEKYCDIHSRFKKTPEQSSRFVYDWIESFGGTVNFYASFFITSICPLGFIKDGKNYNYYDSKELLDATAFFIEKTMEEQLQFGINREVAFCLGKGKNQKYFEELNNKLQLFKNIVPLPHPRWVIQYNKKNYHNHIENFNNMLKEYSNP